MVRHISASAAACPAQCCHASMRAQTMHAPLLLLLRVLCVLACSQKKSSRGPRYLHQQTEGSSRCRGCGAGCSLLHNVAAQCICCWLKMQPCLCCLLPVLLSVCDTCAHPGTEGRAATSSPSLCCSRHQAGPGTQTCRRRGKTASSTHAATHGWVINMHACCCCWVCTHVEGLLCRVAQGGAIV